MKTQYKVKTDFLPKSESLRFTRYSSLVTCYLLYFTSYSLIFTDYYLLFQTTNLVHFTNSIAPVNPETAICRCSTK